MSDRNQGFTILEALVGLMLSAMIATLILNQMSFESTLWFRGSTQSSIIERETTIQSIRHLIESTILFHKQTENGQSVNWFYGNRNAVSFATISDGHLQPGGISLFTVRSTQKGSVVISSEVQGSKAENGSDIELKDLTFELRYFRRNLQDGGPVSTDEWNDSDHIPEMVEVNFVWRDGSQKIFCRLHAE